MLEIRMLPADFNKILEHFWIYTCHYCAGAMKIMRERKKAQLTITMVKEGGPSPTYI